jgi:putative SOS response-associated peptidase YedK
MPVVLTTKEECEIWLTAPWKEAKSLQRPLPVEKMMVFPRYTAVGGLGGHPGAMATYLRANPAAKRNFVYPSTQMANTS